MKPASCALSLFISILFSLAMQAQDQSPADSTGLPGDNFSLQGALQLFQKASSPEDFEKMLNSEDNHVNNLDLNGDGEIDYIRVIDMMEKDMHAFVLQVPVSETESQDIAVIELEKTGDENAMIQIIGDEDIYGEKVIVEPEGSDTEQASSFLNDDNSIAHGPSAGYQSAGGIIINVWFWPSVRFVFGPSYTIWRSPWRWHHYPGWWNPWRPLAWHSYYPYRIRYQRPFVVVHTYRMGHVHRFYEPRRVSSITVRTRNYATVNGYRVSHTKTTITGPRGHHISRKTTRVNGNGRHYHRSTTHRR